MIKCTLMAFLLSTVLLTGCGESRDARAFSEFQRTVAEADSLGFDARITRGGTDTEYAARVSREGEEILVELTAPDTVAGVTFRSGDGGRSLEYDGLILDLTPGQPDALSPCEGGPALLGALSKGSLLYTGRAGEYMTAALTAPGGETVTVWYTPGGGPVYAELGRGDEAELILHMENWHIQE